MAAKKYFHNFNGVRFYLASYVLLFHIEEIKFALHLPSIYHHYKFLEPLGTCSITFFFTMSGFLISYFLFLEKDRSPESKINVRKFYRSRVTRIWPLYFLCMFIYWFLAPHSFLHDIYDKIYFTKFYPTLHDVYLSKGFYFAFFMVLLPQAAGAIAYTFGGMAVYGGHFWSIGSEELFYFFWPLIVNKVKSYKRIFKIAFISVYIWYVLVILLFILNKFYFKNSYMTSILLCITSFLYLTRLYCMLFGCLLAYLYVNDHRYLNFFRKKGVILVSTVLMIIMLAKGLDFPFLIHDIYSIQWAILILHLTRDDLNYKWLNNKWISYFGSITYGVYLYHVIFIILFIFLAQYLEIKSLLYFNLFVYLLSYVSTFAVAHFSYTYYEVKFLRLK